jgi:hypothetical protein
MLSEGKADESNLKNAGKAKRKDPTERFDRRRAANK